MANLPIIQIDDENTQRFQAAIVPAVNQLSANPLLQGVRVSPAAILSSTAPTRIPHKLGRAFIGYFITSQSASSNVWLDTSGTTDLTLYVPLLASSPCTVELWVF